MVLTSAATGRQAAAGAVHDHTPSETRLNRIFYFVKYLRAIVVHAAVMILAYLAYALFDISGFYPLADRSIASIEADLARQGGAPLPPVALAMIGFGVLMALLFWAYLAIVNRWRGALRTLALIGVGYALLFTILFGPEILSFAIGRLHPLFILLYAGSLIFILWVFIDIALATSGAAQSPDAASFRATLDPVLAPTWPVFLNKLVDLPRHPVHSWRMAGAWALQLAATILLIACLGYLASFGAAAAKAKELMAAAVCAEPAPECRSVSFAMGVEIALWMAAAFIGFKAAIFLQELAKRFGAQSVADVLRASDDRFLLYLRPFTADGVPLPKPKLPPVSALFSFRAFPTQLEEELFDVSDGYLPLIAIGKPGDGPSGGRAHRTFLRDDEWQAYVLDKIRRAEAIVMVIDETEGVRWEIDRVMEQAATDKTLFFFNPAARDPEIWSRLSQIALTALTAHGRVAPGFAFSAQPLAFSVEAGRVTEYVNAHWSAVSYRTVFSEYLSGRERFRRSQAVSPG